MTQDLFGQLFGDRGYISQKLFEELYQRGLQLVTKAKKTMKQPLEKLMDKLLLRKRSLIESVNNPLKNICQLVRDLLCLLPSFNSSNSRRIRIPEKSYTYYGFFMIRRSRP